MRARHSINSAFRGVYLDSICRSQCFLASRKKAPSVPDYNPCDVRLSNLHAALVLPKKFPYLEGEIERSHQSDHLGHRSELNLVAEHWVGNSQW